MSLDGVQESKSSTITIDAFTITFQNCKKVYPIRLIRPSNKYKYDEQEQISKVIEDIKLNNCTITAAVSDNPKRSKLRCALCHSATYACEYCESCAISIRNASSISAIKKMYELRRKNIEETINFLKESPGSSASKQRDNVKVNDLNNILKNLKSEEKQDLKLHRKKHKLVWPFSTMTGRLRTTDLIKYVVNKIERSPIELDKHETKGFKGKSHFLYLENFHFIDCIPAEYMHCGCLGTVKRLVELTFNVGEKRDTPSKRKLTDTKEYNIIIKTIQVFREFSRRCRSLDPSVIKAQEYRNMILFFVPIIVDCIQHEFPKERQIWWYLSYIMRACVLPNEEFDLIKKDDIKKACKNFYSLFEKVHGPTNCSYSIHSIGSHILRIRGDDPLTETSAFVYESFYAEMKNLFQPGTTATTKQILQNTLMKRKFEKHFCSKPIKYSCMENNTGAENNSLIYTFKEKQFKFYNIVKINPDRSFQCTEQGRFPYVCSLTPDIDWSTVGVFKQGPSNLNENTIKLCEISGKVLKVKDLLLTCPLNVLKEQ